MEFFAESSGEPLYKAWITHEDPSMESVDFRVPGKHRWRIVVSKQHEGEPEELVRSTIEDTIGGALLQVELYWPSAPQWRSIENDLPIDLHSSLFLI
jgi:hypothetical protein